LRIKEQGKHLTLNEHDDDDDDDDDDVRNSSISCMIDGPNRKIKFINN